MPSEFKYLLIGVSFIMIALFYTSTHFYWVVCGFFKCVCEYIVEICVYDSYSSSTCQLSDLLKSSFVNQITLTF